MSYPPMVKSYPTTWDEDQIKLAKHRSLPELHVRTDFRLVYGAGDDNGSKSSSADQRAKHALKSMPRLLLLVRHQSLIQIGPYDSPPPIERTKAVQQLEENVTSTKDQPNSDLSWRVEDLQDQEPTTVATATPPLPLSQQPSHSLLRHIEFQSQPCDPLFGSSLVRLSSTSSSVDRSDSWSSPMTVIKPSRTIKTSRRNLVIGLDTKTTSLSIDNDNHDLYTAHNSNDEPPRSASFEPFSTLSPKLRRRKRLSLRRSSNPEASPVKSIAISLTFSSSALPKIVSPKASMSALSDRLTNPPETDLASRPTCDAPSSSHPAETPSQADSPERRPAVSMPSLPSTPSSASASFRPSAPTNVRLGHPSRPYYSAIRKHGISPPSSKRSSIKDAALSLTRPKSYSPPSALPSSKITPTSSSPRHLSLSAVSHTSFVSAFSLDDDSDDDTDDVLPVIPLTPMPGRMSFGTSLASVAKSLTRKPSIPWNCKHSHSVSSSSAPLFPIYGAQSSLSALQQGGVKGKGFRMSSPTAAGSSGIGFSVSGETELKMALAFSEAQATKSTTALNGGESLVSVVPAPIQEDHYLSTEQVPPRLSAPSTIFPLPSLSHFQLPIFSNSIASRMKKLRRGLKDMLRTTTHGTGTDTNLTTTTTT